ncbi:MULTISPECIES: hypothetical protein [unclassified Microcoleus]|uniref:hypothetical protein n=1 Tax=unclassified Microcoleus TaxID=2642155 RepID=UPI0025EA160D|nr:MULTISPECIES: hypothetical protein [unclassified Microcoleus]
MNSLILISPGIGAFNQLFRVMNSLILISPGVQAFNQFFLVIFKHNYLYKRDARATIYHKFGCLSTV